MKDRKAMFEIKYSYWDNSRDDNLTSADSETNSNFVGDIKIFQLMMDYLTMFLLI